MAYAVQDENTDERERRRVCLELRIAYNDWIASNHIDDRDQYKGNIFSPGIESFLLRGWMLYRYYQPGGIMPRWVVNVETAFVNRVMLLDKNKDMRRKEMRDERNRYAQCQE